MSEIRNQSSQKLVITVAVKVEQFGDNIMLNIKQEEKRKTTEKIHRCDEGGHADGWCDKRG